MVVAGDHANNDMAGDDEDSWKSIFEGAGYQVECVLHGLGELESVQDMLVEHVQACVDALGENG
jgi:sirohydrochlorin cobaltochelatase